MDCCNRGNCNKNEAYASIFVQEWASGLKEKRKQFRDIEMQILVIAQINENRAHWKPSQSYSVVMSSVEPNRPFLFNSAPWRCNFRTNPNKSRVIVQIHAITYIIQKQLFVVWWRAGAQIARVHFTWSQLFELIL